MPDFRLKLILSGLAGVVFSLIFILLAFSLPIKKSDDTPSFKKPKNRVESISQSLKN